MSVAAAITIPVPLVPILTSNIFVVVEPVVTATLKVRVPAAPVYVL